MATSPIDYGALQSQLNLQPLLQGAALRDNRQQQTEAIAERQATRQLATAQFQMKAGEQEAYLQAVQAYQANPSATALRDLGVRFPEHQKELQDAADSYSSGQKRDLVEAGFGALGALAAGKTDLAVQTLQQRVDALKNSGVDTSHTQAAIDMIRNGDTKGATAYLSYAMGGLVGTDHAAGVLETLGVGAKAEREDARASRDERRLNQGDRRLDIEGRRADAAIRQGDARVDLSRAAGARAAAKASGGAPTAAPAASVASVGGKHYVKRGGKWYQE